VHDGAIHLLPALPDEWKTGEITGLRAPGGFDVSFSWSEGAVQRVEIKSNLGGNCRIRVPNALQTAKGAALEVAQAANPNPFYEVPGVKTPIISEAAKLNALQLAETQLYDLPTEAGQTYTFKFK
jgi:alpha-L-fucosidase 2